VTLAGHLPFKIDSQTSILLQNLCVIGRRKHLGQWLLRLNPEYAVVLQV